MFQKTAVLDANEACDYSQPNLKYTQKITQNCWYSFVLSFCITHETSNAKLFKKKKKKKKNLKIRKNNLKSQKNSRKKSKEIKVKSISPYIHSVENDI